MFLTILFWILWLAWVVGFFVPLSQTAQRGHDIIAALLIGIIGYKVFGSPLDK